MDTRTTDLELNEVERNIKVILRAAQALQLTRFERLSYLALMASVYVITGSFALQFIFGFVTGFLGEETLYSKWVLPLNLEFLVILLGLLSLALNTPLFIKVFRERARLRALGLGSLSESLWQESRRHRWRTRALDGFLIVSSICMFLTASFWLILPVLLQDDRSLEELATISTLGALYFTIITILLVSARYLHGQRKRMDLTASAQQLGEALERLRRRIGKGGVATVPSKILEQTAKIESAEIAKERKDAILQSVASPPNGYLITFDPRAAEQRATLDIADRVEIEDLVAQLSTHGGRLESETGAVAVDKRATLRGTTESRRVEIEYTVDPASRAIQINAVCRTSRASQR
jgi:hypothetical protein